MFILVCPYVRHFSDGNQTQPVCPTYQSWPPIMPKQREQCGLLKIFFYDVSLFDFFIYFFIDALSTAAMPFQAIKCCANVL
jgi:hypothetical protein